MRNLALSLFSGAGIGDIGFRAAGYEFVAMNELEGDRLGIARANFPSTEFIVGDIWEFKNEIISKTKRLLDGDELSLISCTAPCQGMSKNGQGTLLRNIREGRRPPLDPRNRLILPALEIISALRPKFVVFENVVEMKRTVIEDDAGDYRTILEVIQRKLSPEYIGRAYEVEFADYGIPQRRQRLITVYSRLPSHRVLIERGGDLIPSATHSRKPNGTARPWVSVAEAIKDFPPLDAKSKDTASDSSVPYHRVPVLDDLKYYWVSNTPLGRSAFDNQCVTCGYSENPTHSNVRDSSGVNRASTLTPVYCLKCDSLLPRPSMPAPNGRRRLMSGYTSAYKRMDPTLPAPALTRNFSYACSDQKVHPYQNRVLSIAEAMHLQTISAYQFNWSIFHNGKDRKASDALIRLVIGESVPPKFLELLGRYLLETSVTVPCMGVNRTQPELAFG